MDSRDFRDNRAAFLTDGLNPVREFDPGLRWRSGHGSSRTSSMDGIPRPGRLLQKRSMLDPVSLQPTKREVSRFYSSSPSRPSTGVMVPNRPSVSLFIPAVKNMVLAGPAVASFPNVSDQIPSMNMSELSGFLTKPRNSCVKPLKAAIQPLRKLPTRIALLNSPKSRVVHTTPHGAFIQSPC